MRLGSLLPQQVSLTSHNRIGLSAAHRKYESIPIPDVPVHDSEGVIARCKGHLSINSKMSQNKTLYVRILWITIITINLIMSADAYSSGLS